MPRSSDDLKKNEKELADLSTKSSILVYGSDGTLKDEDKNLENIVNQTVILTKDKFGARTNGKPINYFNEVGIGNIFSEFREKASFEKDKKEKENPNVTFKRYMNENNLVDASSLLLAETGRLISFSNYRVIYNHIPECAQALDVYKDNIMSPDDFTKMIFDIDFNSKDENRKEQVEKQLKDLSKKYDIETKADKIIEETLKLGEYYVAALSLNDELETMLNDPILSDVKTLNESTIERINAFDKNIIDTKILKENVEINNDELNALKEVFNLPKQDVKEEKAKKSTKKTLKEDTLNGESLNELDAYKDLVARLINENVEIGSKNQFILENYLAESDYGNALSDIPGAVFNKPKKSKKADTKPLLLNGSAVRLLDPDRVLDLTIDNVNYGFYYIEERANTISGMSYLGTSSGREARQGTGVNMGLNNNVPGMTRYTPATNAANVLNVSEEKLRLISDLFLNQIGKKIDKSFIRHNKKFKDFIYELVRQEYIIKKGIKIVYFTPDEVIKFEAPSIYKKIVFAAKLYLSTMVNDILVKLGRAHDKRIFYINTGLDADYEQAINKVIDDIKRREYKMDNLNDFNNILNLNPGRWDDYFMPTINGERPIEIDTLAGMDTDLNSDFLNYLKNTMMSGIGVPTNLIDNLNDITFARTLSAQNSNFVRSVIRYQKLFTDPFTKLIVRLYKNEYKYSETGESNIENLVDLNSIKVNFPSPATLNMTNISEQIQAVDQNADFIASQLIPPSTTTQNEDARVKLKSKIVQDLLPGIDWEKYKKFKEDLEVETTKEEIKNPPAVEPGMDPYSGM